jgi:hypothetical protein
VWRKHIRIAKAKFVYYNRYSLRPGTKASTKWCTSAQQRWGIMVPDENQAFLVEGLNVGALRVAWLKASPESDTGMCCAHCSVREADGAVLLTFTYDNSRPGDPVVLAASLDDFAVLLKGVNAGQADVFLDDWRDGVDVTIGVYRFVSAGQGQVRVFLASNEGYACIAVWGGERNEMGPFIKMIKRGGYNQHVTAPAMTGPASGQVAARAA